MQHSKEADVPGLLPDVDPDGLLEYSVVYSDRSLNHMSPSFQAVMRDLSQSLRTLYGAASVAILPGSGTFAMEAVARQFATDRSCLVLRNGWFSFRWSQIFEAGGIPASEVVLKALPADDTATPAFAPHPLDQVVAAIRDGKPDVVFAPHVETSSGILLPDDYLAAVADAVHAVGGLFVLDCVASGAVWVDMEALGIDVVVSAPQKGLSGSPCCGLVLLGPQAAERLGETQSTSFACNLATWRDIMAAYERGGHAYHATLPTDGLRVFRDVLHELAGLGFDQAKARQQELGRRARAVLVEHGFKSVAAEGFEAPGVVVSYTGDPEVRSGQKFRAAGLQIAAGVPLRCDEPDPFPTFRLGLFGLDKLVHVDRTVDTLAAAVEQIAGGA